MFLTLTNKGIYFLTPPPPDVRYTLKGCFGKKRKKFKVAESRQCKETDTGCPTKHDSW